MSKEIYEVRWHGRGGQGAKSASMILADAALESGKHIQAFPEYGAERQGAPMKAFNRISGKPIRLHCGVTNPNLVVVVDDTLLRSIPVTEGLDDDGILLVNTPESSDDIRKRMNFRGKIFTLNATQISLDELGSNKPNMPLLGAVEKVAELTSLDLLREKLKKLFLRKLGEEITNRNIKSLERGYNEVR